MNLECVVEEVKKGLDAIWQEFRNDFGGIPDMLYHYTNAAGLRGILESGRIWATHALYLNDPREIFHGQGILEQATANFGRPTISPEHSTFLSKWSENLRRDTSWQEDMPGAYFASFSTKADDLSQYRAYSDGGAGYCLGFAPAELVKNAGQHRHADGSLFTLMPIEYDERVQKAVVRRHLDLGWNKARSLLGEVPHEKSEVFLDSIAQACVRAALRLCWFFKQSGFRDEDEWRIVPSTVGSPQALPLADITETRIRGGLFVHYLTIPLADEKGKTSLKEIYIGPKLPYKRALSGLLKLPAFQRAERKGALVEIKRSATFLQ